MATKDPHGVDTTEVGPSDSIPYSEIPRSMTPTSDTEHTLLDEDTSNASDSQPNGSLTNHATNSNTSAGFPLLELAAELRTKIMEQTMPTRVKLISAPHSITGPVRFSLPDEDGTPSSEFHNLPHLNVLHTCRQIFHEAQFFPYQFTLFELGDIRDAMMFFATLSPNKLANIRRIRVECKLRLLHYIGWGDWDYHVKWMAFCAFARRALTDLRELHIDLLGCGYGEYHASTAHSPNNWISLPGILDMNNDWVQALVQLRNLPLSKVTILPDNGGLVSTDTMVEEQRVNFAETVTRTLLRQ